MSVFDSKRVIKRGFDEKEPTRQCYECKDCGNRFDDLTDTMPRRSMNLDGSILTY